MKEERRAKFVRLANKRVNRAIKAIQLVGNLSNRSNYDYTEDDVGKIFSALNAEMKATKKRFESAGMDREDQFKLDL